MTWLTETWPSIFSMGNLVVGIHNFSGAAAVHGPAVGERAVEGHVLQVHTGAPLHGGGRRRRSRP